MTRASVKATARTDWQKRLPERRQLLIVALSFFTICPLLTAQDSTQPTTDRFEFTSLVGYRNGMRLTTQPGAQGTNPRFVIVAGPTFGFSFGVRIRDDDIAEFRWSRQDSYAQLQAANGAYPRSNLILDEFHCDFRREYVLGHRAPWARPFIMGSVGATNVSSGPSTASTHFSVGVGGGVKFFMNQHLAIRIQAEWLPTFVDPQGTVSCGPGCIAHLGGMFGSQVEIAAGPVFRF
jgi:hypothetical protein